MRSRRRGLHANAKGRSDRAEQFWMLKFKMVKSPAFRSLSGSALKVLAEIRCRYNGTNRFTLHLSYKEGADLLGLSKSTVHRAFRELTEKGFVKQTRQGMRYARLASEWTVTDIEPKEPGQTATNEWRHWRPPPKKQGFGTQKEPWGRDGPAEVPVDASRFTTVPKTGASGMPDGAASVPPVHSTMRSDAAKPPASEAAARALRDGIRQLVTKGRGLSDESEA